MLVSTDKAVSPATVMGASKALAECAIEAAQRRFPATRYVAVRFGNVLGSSGSVVPIFRRQIAAGGPVTVTDARMTPLLHDDPGGGAADHPRRLARPPGARREVFVLDMGEPVHDHRPGARDDRALGPRARARHRDRDRRPRAPARSCTRSCSTRYERPQPTPAEKILLAEREPLAPDAVEAIFDEICLLVLEGDAAGLAEKVAELSPRGASRRRRARSPPRRLRPSYTPRDS